MLLVGRGAIVRVRAGRPRSWRYRTAIGHHVTTSLTAWRIDSPIHAPRKRPCRERSGTQGSEAFKNCTQDDCCNPHNRYALPKFRRSQAQFL